MTGNTATSPALRSATKKKEGYKKLVLKVGS